MKASELPPLPTPKHRGPDGTGSYFDSFTADQLSAYAEQAVKQERDAILGLCSMYYDADEVAVAIRTRTAASSRVAQQKEMDE